MTTMAQVDKRARNILQPFLVVEHGFVRESPGLYVRRRSNGLLDVVLLECVKGTHGRLWATVQTDGMLDYKYQRRPGILGASMIHFSTGGCLGEEGIKKGYEFMLPVGSDDEIDAYLAKSIKLIVKYVFPFFDGISGPEDIWDILKEKGYPDEFRAEVLGK